MAPAVVEAKKPRRMENAKSVSATMGVSQRSLTRWARDGHYRVRRTPGGQYLFEVDEDGWPIEVREQ